ncbi:hemicentin-1 [Caerostris extrusa]|uniref:Hemicentin-1 n=1 Tax=Caerostris extrusa TaxID=172846 RepID=A0AAV4QIC8_CAEEX|nr:hemicentin-1 [Caerostris extrusa]
MCSVRADPLPIVSWYVNDSIIIDGPRRTITEDGLFVRNLKTTDAGNYTCRAFVVTPHKSQIQDKDIAVYVHCTKKVDDSRLVSFSVEGHRASISMHRSRGTRNSKMTSKLFMIKGLSECL